MDDQFTNDVKALKEKGLSERKIATELKVSKSKVHDTLQKLQQAENTADSLPEERLRSIIREELKAAHDAEEEETKEKEKADGQFPVIRKMGGGVEVRVEEAACDGDIDAGRAIAGGRVKLHAKAESNRITRTIGRKDGVQDEGCLCIIDTF